MCATTGDNSRTRKINKREIVELSVEKAWYVTGSADGMALHSMIVGPGHRCVRFVAVSERELDIQDRAQACILI